MKFTELLTPETIRQGMISSSKKRVFESIARIVEEQLHMENGEQCCFDCLFAREKLGNSGLGGGVAMPKGRLPNNGKPIGVFIQLESPIDYEASDKREVDLIFAVLNLVDKSLCKQLRAAKSADEIWGVFSHYDQCEAEEIEVDEEDFTSLAPESGSEE